MQFSLEMSEGLKHRFKIAIMANNVDQKATKRLQKSGQRIRLDGFRAGKIPLKVLKKRFGASVREEVVSELIQNSFMEAIKANNMNPVGISNVEESQNEEGKDLIFFVDFETFPEFELKDFREIKIDQYESEVLDSDIDSMIEKLRNQCKEWKTCTNPEETAQLGDRLTLDYDQTIKDSTEHKENEEIELGSKSMPPGFEDGLIGAKKGESKTLNLALPNKDKEPDETMVTYQVTVNEIKRSHLPEINNDFFKNFNINVNNQNDGLEQFRTEVKKNMEQTLQASIQDKMKVQILDCLVDAYDFQVPDILIEQECEQLIDQIIQKMENMYGINNTNLDRSKIPLKLYKDTANRRIKLGLIFAEISKKENVDASDEQVQQKISQEAAARYEYPQPAIDAYYENKELIEKIKYSIVEDNIIKLISDAAEKNIIKCSYDDAIKPLQNKNDKAKIVSAEANQEKNQDQVKKVESIDNGNKD